MNSYYEFHYGTVHHDSPLDTRPFWSVIYDINGDGLEDIFLFGFVYPPDGPGDSPLRLFLQRPDGNFDAINPMADGSDFLTTHPRFYEFADFNNDGFVDIFVATHGYDTDPFPGEQNRLLLGQAGGRFIEATDRLPSIVDFSHGLAIGDIDGNGTLDVFISNLGGESEQDSYLLLNDGSANFTLTEVGLPEWVVQGGKIGKGFTTAKFADMDKDGHVDLLLGGDGISSSVLWNDGTGRFDQEPVLLPSPAYQSYPIVQEFIVHDFNNDGLPDLLVAGIEALFAPGGLQVLINGGDRSFTDATSDFFADIPRTSMGFDVRLIDVNGDGALDIVRKNFVEHGDDVVMWLNGGANYFQPLTKSQLTFDDDDLVYMAYYGPDGEVRLLSGVNVWEGDGIVNYFTPKVTVSELIVPGKYGYNYFGNVGGSDSFFGIGPRDTVKYEVERSNFSVEWTSAESVSVLKPTGSDALISIERIQFDDGALLFDMESANLGFTYRIYAAAFDRAPDEGGLRYWVDIMDWLDANDPSAHKEAFLALQFLQAPEFVLLYGENSSDSDYINAIYQNVLDRLPDQEGYDYWVEQMQLGLSRAGILIEFAESQENVSNTAPDLTDGVWVL